jgi:hypothetical protein
VKRYIHGCKRNIDIDDRRVMQTKMNKLKSYKFWLTLLSWLAWLIAGAILILTPDGLHPLVVALLVLTILVLAVAGAVGIALTYRRFLASWLGIGGLVVAMALTYAGAAYISENGGGLLFNLLTYLKLSLPFIYLASVTAFMWKRDISVSLLGILLLIMIWTAAVGVTSYRGVANLILAYLKALDHGTFWWWDTWVTAFYCALPPIFIGFWAHLLRLAWKEWKRD